LALEMIEGFVLFIIIVEYSTRLDMIKPNRVAKMQIFDVVICPVKREHKLALVVIGVFDFFVFVLATFNLIIRHIHIVLPVLLLRILRDIDIVAELYDFGVLLLELVARPQIELGELAWCILEFDSF